MVTEVEEPVETKTKGKILIVDDETVVRDSLGKWFSCEGYQARPVASGSTPSSATRLSTPLEPMMAVFTAPDKIRVPTSTTKAWNSRRTDIGPTRNMESPPIRLFRNFCRAASGTIITAKKETSDVNSML